MSIFFIFFFILGLFIGSFLNVLIDRLPRNESILGRSHCEHCKKTLAWWDLIPLLSFISLRGRCRYCRTSLSLQYPLLELFTGILFALTYVWAVSDLYSPLSLIYYLIFVSSLIVIFFADIKYGIIPDKILIPTTIATFVWLLFVNQTGFMNHILSAVGLLAFFALIFLLTRGRGMGFGDVKFSFLIGLSLGFSGAFLAVYIAFLTGAVVGIILILWKKKRLNYAVPFGPFLVVGCFVSLFFSNIIVPKVLALLR